MIHPNEETTATVRSVFVIGPDRKVELTLILPSLSDAEARERFPDGWDAPRPYLRLVPQPGR